jgi:hypothetical protein
MSCCLPGPGAIASAGGFTAKLSRQRGPKVNFVAVDIGPGEPEPDITDFLTANQATSLAYTNPPEDVAAGWAVSLTGNR